MSTPTSTICSLLPSATEIVFALGLGDRLVAVTHECDFPPEAARLAVITRTTLDHHETRRSHDIHTHISTALHGGSGIYLLDQNILQQLAPDLILTQELCDVCAVSYETVKLAVRRLPGRATILSLEPTTFQGILDTIRQVGEATGTTARAASLVRELEEQADTIEVRARTASGRPRVFAMEWLDPPFTAGHWVPELVRRAGGRDDLARDGASGGMERPTRGAIRMCLCRTWFCVFQSPGSAHCHGTPDSGRDHPPGDLSTNHTARGVAAPCRMNTRALRATPRPPLLRANRPPSG